jgi:hypothetical protein
MVAVSIMVALVLGLLHLRVKNEFQKTQDDKPHVDLTKPDIEK